MSFSVESNRPLSIFVVIGAVSLLLLIFCFPSKSLASAIFRWLGCQFDEDDDGSGIRKIHYRYLSAHKKLELDTSREVALRDVLAPFSMKVSEEHMLVKKDLIEYSNKSEIGNEREIDSQNKQMLPAVGVPAEDDVEKCQVLAEEEGKYSHISIPLPGFTRNGINAAISETSVPATNRVVHHTRKSFAIEAKRDSKDQRIRHCKPSFFFRLTRKSKQIAEEEVGDGVSGDDTTCQNVIQQPPTKQQNEKREVPIHCAICLTDYTFPSSTPDENSLPTNNDGDKLCWSSNPECPHHFHQDCIVQWFIALGREKSMVHPYNCCNTNTTNKRKFINWRLECPCCRQDFIILREDDIDVEEDGVHDDVQEGALDV